MPLPAIYPTAESSVFGILQKVECTRSLISTFRVATASERPYVTTTIALLHTLLQTLKLVNICFMMRYNGYSHDHEHVQELDHLGDYWVSGNDTGPDTGWSRSILGAPIGPSDNSYYAQPTVATQTLTVSFNYTCATANIAGACPAFYSLKNT